MEIFVVSDTQIQLIAAENTDNSVEITNLKQGETLNLSKENLISSNEDTARVSPAGLVTALNTGYTAIFSTESESPELVRIISVSGEAAISLGDVNQDGTINAKDAAEVLVASAKIGAGLSSDLTEEQEKNADVNHDGNVNAKDAALILTYAAEIGAGSFTGTMEEFMNGK